MARWLVTGWRGVAAAVAGRVPTDAAGPRRGPPRRVGRSGTAAGTAVRAPRSGHRGAGTAAPAPRASDATRQAGGHWDRPSTSAVKHQMPSFGMPVHQTHTSSARSPRMSSMTQQMPHLRRPVHARPDARASQAPDAASNAASSTSERRSASQPASVRVSGAHAGAAHAEAARPRAAAPLSTAAGTAARTGACRGPWGSPGPARRAAWRSTTSPYRFAVTYPLSAAQNAVEPIALRAAVDQVAALDVDLLVVAGRRVLVDRLVESPGRAAAGALGPGDVAGDEVGRRLVGERLASTGRCRPARRTTGGPSRARSR